MNTLLSYLGSMESSISSSYITTAANTTGFHPALITIIGVIGTYPIYYITSRTLMYVFDYKYVHITTKNFVCKMSPLINYCTTITSENYKCGYIASKGFKLFGYIDINDNGGYSSSGYVYISNKYLTDYKLLEEKIVEITKYNTNKTYSKIYNSSANGYNNAFIHANHVCWNKTPTALQNVIIDKIINTLSKNTKNNCVVLLSGSVGAGKSMLCRLLAGTINASLYDEYNLCETAAYSFDGVINYLIKPTKAEPVVIVLEEVDCIIDNVHNNLVVLNQNYHIPVKNKTDWNNFLDRIDYGQYPNVVLIMTTNKPRQWFDDLDPAYMREGRVHLHIDIDSVAAELAATADTSNKDKAD
jgi:hypothetical protein